MALTRHKSGPLDTASIPVVCEVCRERPVTRLVVNFIFACDLCAKKISTELWHGREERTLTAGSVSSELET
jgi:ribosomal protein L37AE/L43A